MAGQAWRTMADHRQPFCWAAFALPAGASAGSLAPTAACFDPLYSVESLQQYDPPTPTSGAPLRHACIIVPIAACQRYNESSALLPQLGRADSPAAAAAAQRRQAAQTQDDPWRVPLRPLLLHRRSGVAAAEAGIADQPSRQHAKARRGHTVHAALGGGGAAVGRTLPVLESRANTAEFNVHPRRPPALRRALPHDVGDW